MAQYLILLSVQRKLSYAQYAELKPSDANGITVTNDSGFAQSAQQKNTLALYRMAQSMMTSQIYALTSESIESTMESFQIIYFNANTCNQLAIIIISYSFKL